MTKRQRLIRLRPALGIGATMMTVWGLVYTFPLFVVPLSTELDLDRAALAGVVVALLFFGAVVGPPLGALVDRIGPRPAIAAGLLLAVAGYAAFSLATELWQVYLAFAGLLGAGQTLIYLGGNVLIARSFDGGRGTAYGIAYAGLGVGTGVYAIGGQLLIEALGWRSAALVLSLTPLLVLPLVFRLSTASRPSGHVADVPWGEAPRGLATLRAFALVFAASLALGLVDEGIYQNLLPHAVDVGFTPTAGAVALSVVSLAYVAGQLLGGPAADRFGPRPVALAAFVVAALGMAGVLTAQAGGPAAEARLIGASLLYGGGLAILLLVRLATFADRFAGRNFGFLSGVFALAYPIGGSAITFFGGLSFDAWGTYLPAFGLSALGLLAALAALLVVAVPVAPALPARRHRAAADAAAPVEA